MAWGYQMCLPEFWVLSVASEAWCGRTGAVDMTAPVCWTHQRVEPGAPLPNTWDNYCKIVAIKVPSRQIQTRKQLNVNLALKKEIRIIIQSFIYGSLRKTIIAWAHPFSEKKRSAKEQNNPSRGSTNRNKPLTLILISINFYFCFFSFRINLSQVAGIITVSSNSATNSNIKT